MEKEESVSIYTDFIRLQISSAAMHHNSDFDRVMVYTNLLGLGNEVLIYIKKIWLCTEMFKCMYTNGNGNK